MLTLEKLTYLYEHLPMRFDLRIQPGERVAVLGPSGAGKSTLLSLIAGFLPAASGRLLLNGEDHTATPPAKRPVSMLFQENNLFAHLTVAQNIGLGLDPGLRLTEQQRQQRAHIARQVGLEEHLERLPSQLSGGQRQRAALARCLIRQRPILLLDEPFSALDPALRNEMLQLLQTVCEQRNLTLLMVSHNLDDAARIAPRTLLVVDGRIYYDGPTQALLDGSAPEWSPAYGLLPRWHHNRTLAQQPKPAGLTELTMTHFNEHSEFHAIRQAIEPLLAQHGIRLIVQSVDYATWHQGDARSDLWLGSANFYLPLEFSLFATLYELPLMQHCMNEDLAQDAELWRANRLPLAEFCQRLVSNHQLHPLFHHWLQLHGQRSMRGVRMNTLGWFDFKSAWFAPPEA